MFRRAMIAAKRARSFGLSRNVSQTGGEFTARFSSPARETSASGRGLENVSRSFTTSIAASASALYGSMLVERIPVVIPEPPAWEREYLEWAQARRDKFKVKLPDEMVEAKGLIDNLPDFDAAPRETEADHTGDRSTMYRKLPEFLFLVLKDKSGTWGFPKAPHTDGETMRQTAERSLKDFAGDSLECWVVGNAPQGHYEEQGVTTFYYRGSYVEGELELQGDYVEHAWVTKEELGEFFDDSHHDLLKRML